MNELDWSHLPGRCSIYPLSILILTSPTILARPPHMGPSGTPGKPCCFISHPLLPFFPDLWQEDNIHSSHPKGKTRPGGQQSPDP